MEREDLSHNDPDSAVEEDGVAGGIQKDESNASSRASGVASVSEEAGHYDKQGEEECEDDRSDIWRWMVSLSVWLIGTLWAITYTWYACEAICRISKAY